jgi:uridylate kinase
LEVDIVIKATKVNGVYSADPHKFPDAIRYNQLTYQDVLTQKLNVMDMTAFTLCEENNMPILIVNFWEDDNLLRAIKGETEIGTLIK